MGCCKVVKIFGFLGLGFLAYSFYTCNQTPSLPVLEADPWWGPGKRSHANTDIIPFKIQIPKEDIADLKTRLSLPLRLTPGLENANFTYGFNAETLRHFHTYWLNNYDWTKREERLNKFKQFKTQIEGLDIHFIHITPKVTSGKKIVPLLIIHGWPGSLVEFDEIIPILTTAHQGQDIVFEVIAPSIPGYGFSQASSKMGLGVPQVGQIFLKLMKRLNKNNFYIQGGDWGSMISSTMATYFPDNILGLHMNMMSVSSPIVNFKYGIGSYLPSGFIMAKESEEKFYPISKFFSTILRESGYAHIQSTKPDTIGTALNESPIGLAAYILEKFSFWTKEDYVNEPDGGLLKPDFPISRDRLLDNLSLYWFTKSITTSMRFYAETLPNLFKWRLDEIPTVVPAGFTSFKYEVANHPVTFLAHKYTNIKFYKFHHQGGHFAAMELPKVLASDIFTFISDLENPASNSDKKEL